MTELDAIIAEGITLMAIQSAKSAENAILAADAPQSPRGQTMTDTAPDPIYLQWYDEDGEHDRGIEATWCQDRINANDLEYRRHYGTAHWQPYNDLQAESQRQQIAGLVAERDALMAVVAAKQSQAAALLAERAALRQLLQDARAMSDKWRRLYVETQAQPGDLVFEVSAVTDDGAE
jgi:hypothetical protein